MPISYNYSDKSQWNLIQTRSLDPYSLLQSDTLNKMNNVYFGGDNKVVSGMNIIAEETLDKSKIVIKINPGVVIKDSVLIRFESDITITIDTDDSIETLHYLAEKFPGKVGYVVVNYRFSKVKPAPIAVIEVISEDEYSSYKESTEVNPYLRLLKIKFTDNYKYDSSEYMSGSTGSLVTDSLVQQLTSNVGNIVKDYIVDLGVEGTADLFKDELSFNGISVTKKFEQPEYYLIKKIEKVNYTGLLRVEIGLARQHAVNDTVEEDWYVHKYTFSISSSDYSLKTYNEILTTDVEFNRSSIENKKNFAVYSTDKNVYGRTYLMSGFDVLIFQDTRYYYVYAVFAGDIKGYLRCLEDELNTGTVKTLDPEISVPEFYNQSTVWQASAVNKQKITNTYVNNYIVWNESNDGHLSGLDADLLDGHHAKYFVSQTDLKNSNKLIYADLKTEETERKNADAELKSYIDTKAAETDTQISNIKQDISVLETNLNQEVVDRTTGDQQLNNKIDTEVDRLDDKIDSESENRVLEDTALSNRIEILTDTYIPLSEKGIVPSYYTDDEETSVEVKTTVTKNGTEYSFNRTLKGKDTHGVATLVPYGENDVAVEQTATSVCNVLFHSDDVNPSGETRLNCEGHLYATKIFNPSYKDIAETFDSMPGYNQANCVNKIMVIDYETGLVRPCTRNDYAVVGVCSDTYGTLLGSSEDDLCCCSNKVAIGIAGTVWVELEHELDDVVSSIGAIVGCGANGKGRLIPRHSHLPSVGMVIKRESDTSRKVKILIGNHW